MTAKAIYPPSGSSGEIQFANSSGLLDASKCIWDVANSRLGINKSSTDEVSHTLTVDGHAVVSGNLEVLGTKTVIDTQHLQVEDPIIGLGTGSAGEGAVGDRGLIFLMTGETNPSFYWDESADEFRIARLTNVPGDSSFDNPTNTSNGGYQSLRVKTVTTISGAMFDSEQRAISSIGTDVFIYASGSTDKRSVFGGDVVISGTLYGGSPLKIGGELEFVTPAGDTTSIKNPSGSVKVFASEEVKIGSDDGLIRLIDLGGSSAGKIFLTGSSTVLNRRLKFLSKGQIHFHGKNPNAESPGTDVFLFVSGSAGSKQGFKRGVSLFGGDVAMSGSLVCIGGLSGSLTRLTGGTSYLAAGSDVTISSASSGQVTVISNAQDQRKKFVYEVTGSHLSSGRLEMPSINFSNVEYVTDRIDVFVNGQLMSSGSGNDYSLPHTGSVKFTFDLISGDIVTVRTY